MQKFFVRSLFSLFFLAMATATTARPLQVVVSFSVLADMVRNVGGDAVDVIALVGPDADAHAFDPSPRDARHVAKAELVFVNGLHFEGWIGRLIKASGYDGRVVVASRGITPRLQSGEADPHAWQSLGNGRIYVENIRAALVMSLPAQAASLNARATAYQMKMDVVERELKSQIAKVPAARRRVISSHDAFGYFGAAYGIEFLAPQGGSTDSEASAGDVARIIRQIKAQGVTALFVENITDPRLIERIAAEAGGVVGGKLYSDALSPLGTAADSYLKMFQHNGAVLVRGMLAPSRSSR